MSPTKDRWDFSSHEEFICTLPKSVVIQGREGQSLSEVEAVVAESARPIPTYLRPRAPLALSRPLVADCGKGGLEVAAKDVLRRFQVAVVLAPDAIFAKKSLALDLVIGADLASVADEGSDRGGEVAQCLDCVVGARDTAQ
jgi:hypothetical protein